MYQLVTILDGLMYELKTISGVKLLPFVNKKTRELRNFIPYPQLSETYTRGIIQSKRWQTIFSIDTIENCNFKETYYYFNIIRPSYLRRIFDTNVFGIQLFFTCFDT